MWLLRADGQWIESPRPDGKTARRFDNAPVTNDPARPSFDAPAYDQAWWRKTPKRVAVVIHRADGQAYGQVQHGSSPDISRDIMTNRSFAKATVRAGQAKVFLSVLIPHDAAEKPEDVVTRVRTAVHDDGRASARIGKVEVAISPAGD